MILTIDGPAGAGKSTIAKGVANRLGFAFLDTGAMYRCVTLAALEAGADFQDPTSLHAIATDCQIEFSLDKVWLNRRDVTQAIRTPQVTKHIRFVADHPEIRSWLNQQQRRIAADRDIVTEGRDQGTEVFPEAECKVFLTASIEERARRRQRQLAQSGTEIPLEQLIAEQNERDRGDQQRQMGRLQPAHDARLLVTDGMTPEQVIQQICQWAADR